MKENYYCSKIANHQCAYLTAESVEVEVLYIETHPFFEARLGRISRN